MTDQSSWFPQAWRPNPGDTISGGVVAINVGEAGWGAYPIVVLRVPATDSNLAYDKAVHAFHDVLQNELAARQVQVGDVIEITYLGKHEKGYHGYRVTGAERAFDWTQFGAAAGPAAAPAPARPPGPSDVRPLPAEVFIPENAPTSLPAATSTTRPYPADVTDPHNPPPSTAPHPADDIPF